MALPFAHSRVFFVSAMLLALLARGHAQAPALSFDVDSVRPDEGAKSSSNVPLGPGDVYSPTHGVLTARGFSLFTYLVFAYKLTDSQQEALRTAAPDWVVSDRYSIDARTGKLDVTKDELRLMMRSLLAARFKLAAHYEDREVRVYALELITPGTLGPKLRPHPANAVCEGFNLKKTAGEGKTTDVPLQPEKGTFPVVCGGILGLPASAEDRYSFGAAGLPMSVIATSFSGWGNLGRPVVDRTGLTGTYDFVMDYTPIPRPTYTQVDSGGPTFQQALKQQLGLKLEATRAAVPFLVIDHVERPDAN